MNFNVSEEDIQLFLEECDELLEQLEADLLTLEKVGGDDELLGQIFRAAHTLKGSSATLGHKPMSEFTHRMENLLSKLRSHELTMNQEIGDVLLASLDILRAFRDEIESGEPGNVQTADVLATIAQLSGDASAEVAAAAQPVAAAPPRQVGEMEQARLKELLEDETPVWEVSIELDQNGLMPAVRAFQLLMAAEEWGELIWSEPSMSEVEAEKVGSHVQMLLSGTAPAEQLQAALAAVPETHVTAFTQVTSWPPAGAAPAPAKAPAAASAEAAPAQASGQQQARAAQAGQRRSGNRSIRVSVDLLDNLMNLVGELVIDRTRLTRIVSDLGEQAGELGGELGRTSNHIGRITADLQEEIMRARMLPVENLFKKFPRMIRDLAQSQGKEIELLISGEETELDRSIIEVIGDPLLHLLRNAIDHAIEPPDERLAAGKDKTGRIWLEAAHEEGSIVIVVRDDGRGMDREKIAAKALERGLVTEEQLRRMDEQAILELLFAPGFSTAQKVTDVSGRGVGMDVVRSNIERLNGTVTLSTELGKGSEVRIRLPLTLAIIQALLVGIHGETYAIPLSNVLEATMVRRDAIERVQNQEVMSLRGQVIALLDMRRTFGFAASDAAELPVVVVAAGNRQIGLVVDGLEGEQEIVVKSLGALGQMTSGLAGATILGDGSVSLILDVPALVNKNGKEELNRGYSIAG